MSDAFYSSKHSGDSRPGPYLAKVVNHLDTTYMGSLEVEIMRPIGNTAEESEIHQVKYMSPFYGVTANFHLGNDEASYDDTQKSYGMWMVPPDIGTTVIVIFIDGDTKRGYWIGCVQDEGMNFMIPGLAATQKVVEDVDPDLAGKYGRVPVAEYNKKASDVSDVNTTNTLKPRHPFTDALASQGLLLDDIRGITSSSARREVPSMVFGISTPGPKDKQGPTGEIGRSGATVPDAYTSRLGGTTFVMDDGDERFLRKTPPSEGPPEYASLDAEETDGDTTIPHNELVRIRTRTGHQILLHNSEDLIYITNSRGTAWVELSSDGKIDIYAQDSISVRTENDFNFYADRDFNIEVGRNFNLKVAERHQTEVGADKILIVDGNNNIKIVGDYNTTVEGATLLTTAGDYDVNTEGSNTLTTAANLNLKSADATKITAGAGVDVKSGDGTKITAGAGLDIKSGGASKWTAGGTASIGGSSIVISGGTIDLNGPAAPAAAAAADAPAASDATIPDPLTTFQNPTEIEGAMIESIMVRIPTTEPYPHHENLDATMFKPDKTDREVEGDIAVPDAWQKYTTATDTFAIQPPKATAGELQDTPTDLGDFFG